MVEAEEEYVEQLEILISCFLRPFKVSIGSSHKRRQTDFPPNFKCFEEKYIFVSLILVEAGILIIKFCPFNSCPTCSHPPCSSTFPPLDPDYTFVTP
jgi:hypothetical protein